MDPILWMMFCSTVEAMASTVMGASLLYLAYDQWRRNLNERREAERSNLKGTW
jgi:hypothetical protein